ncbi:MAG TPA: fasciclin domain-containing protein [Clostridia bacterium]|nr:fasciclin domain-containing protein [Clostridia bacterium]
MNNTLLKLLKLAKMDEFLDTQGPFTIFAPNDEAFEELPEDLLNSLLKGENLETVLNYHIVEDERTADDLRNIPSLETLGGEEILIDTLDDTIAVNDAALIKEDIGYDNGIIQVIDSVLMP